VVTGHGNGWSEPRVRSFRNHHEIEVFRDGELVETAEKLTCDHVLEVFDGLCVPKTLSELMT
jgi:hypothetical protein